MNETSESFDIPDEQRMSVYCWLDLGFNIVLGDSVTTLTFSAELAWLILRRSRSVLEALNLLVTSCLVVELLDVSDSPNSSLSSDILID